MTTTAASTAAWIASLRDELDQANARTDRLIAELAIAETTAIQAEEAPAATYDEDTAEALGWVAADLNRAVLASIAQEEALAAQIAGLEAGTLAARHARTRHLTAVH